MYAIATVHELICNQKTVKTLLYELKTPVPANAFILAGEPDVVGSCT